MSYAPYTERFGCAFNDEFDRRLAAWMEAERQLAEAHLNFARDLQADLDALFTPAAAGSPTPPDAERNTK